MIVFSGTSKLHAPRKELDFMKGSTGCRPNWGRRTDDFIAFLSCFAAHSILFRGVSGTVLDLDRNVAYSNLFPCLSTKPIGLNYCVTADKTVP